MTVDELKSWESNKVLWLFWDGPDMPNFVKLGIETIRRNSNMPTILLDDELAWGLIGKKPPMYDKLKHWAHKADIIRWALLYRYGGLWLDTDTILLHPLDHLYAESVSKNRVIFHKYTTDPMPKETKSITNTFLACPAKHPLAQDILRDAIDVLIRDKGGNEGLFNWFSFIDIMAYNIYHTDYEYRLLHPSSFLITPFDYSDQAAEGPDFFGPHPRDTPFKSPGTLGLQPKKDEFNRFNLLKWAPDKLLRSSEHLVSFAYREALGIGEQ